MEYKTFYKIQKKSEWQVLCHSFNSQSVLSFMPKARVNKYNSNGNFLICCSHQALKTFSF